MINVKYISADGSETEVELTTDDTLMVGAINNGIEGIVGECGGICSCATCHVYVDQAWVDSIPQADFMEDARLGHAIDRKENSRLACQISLDDTLNGIVVRMPESQH